MIRTAIGLTAPLWLGALLAIAGVVFGAAIAIRTIAISYCRFVCIARRHLRL